MGLKKKADRTQQTNKGDKGKKENDTKLSNWGHRNKGEECELGN